MSLGKGNLCCWIGRSPARASLAMGAVLSDARASRRLAQALLAAILLFAIVLAACRGAESETSSGVSRGRFGVGDLLCTYTPSACDGGKLSQFYAADPRTIYERTLGERTVYVPIGYVDDTDLLIDLRRPGRNLNMHLLGLLPELAPRTPDNVQEFFVPYERNAVRITVYLPGGAGAKPWSEVAASHFNMTRHGANSPIRRSDKFGLEVWGEDYAKWPKRRPCANLGKGEPPCGDGNTKDALRPIETTGPTSVMECDPDILVDIDAQVIVMSHAEREAYFESRQWFGRRRAMCTHDMFYEPWSAHVMLQYPRRFIAQWHETEQKVRALLDSVQRTPQTPPPTVWHR